MPKEVKLLLATSIICTVLTIAGVFILLQAGIVAIRRSNALVFDAYNARLNRVEEALTSPEPSPSASVTPSASASAKKAVKTEVPSPTTEPSPAQ